MGPLFDTQAKTIECQKKVEQGSEPSRPTFHLQVQLAWQLP